MYTNKPRWNPARFFVAQIILNLGYHSSHSNSKALYSPLGFPIVMSSREELPFFLEGINLKDL